MSLEYRRRDYLRIANAIAYLRTHHRQPPGLADLERELPEVMERAGVTPEDEIDLDALTPEEEEKLAPYRDFIEGLDLGDLDE